MHVDGKHTKDEKESRKASVSLGNAIVSLYKICLKCYYIFSRSFYIGHNSYEEVLS